MGLQRIGVKVFAEEHGTVALTEFIPVFHRWIQERSLSDVLIDVADYSHVHHGPGVLVIAHEGNYGYDETGGERGLLYYTKHELPGDLPSRLRTITRKLLSACKLVEDDAVFRERIRFPGTQLEIFANDRLAAPNSAETMNALRPAIDGLLAELYGKGKFTLTQEPGPKKRFALRVEADSTPGITEMLAKLLG